MRTVAFDGRMGASGDMLLGALLAAGADRTVLEPIEEALGVRYELESVTKCGISATSVDVLLTGLGVEDERSSALDEPTRDHGDDCDHEDAPAHNLDDAPAHDHGDVPARGHDHSHDHSHDHDHDHVHDHDHSHDHAHAEGAGPHRTYPEVVELVEGMGLDPVVESDAKAVFRLLGEAEASVHGTDLEETHFHEVGADDAIADVTGAITLLADLGADRVVTTPLSAGGGEVRSSHGVYPVPVPAVVEIATRASFELRGGPVERELLTPTGAAILGHVADPVTSLPALSVAAVGYGAGSMDLPEHPNVLRVLVGEATGELVPEELTVLETNVDDVTPEVLGGLHDTLADAGARDVSIVPLTMKKSRPGHLVRVVVRPEDAAAVARKLAVETGTLGVRAGPTTHRWIATRNVRTVSVQVGDETYDVDVKVATDDAGAILDVSAEYDDASAVASTTGRPIREIMRRAEDAAFESLPD